MFAADAATQGLLDRLRGCGEAGPSSDQEKDAERQLVASVRRGEAESLERLVGEYTDLVAGAAWRLLRHKEDACDAVELAILHAVGSIRRSREHFPLSAWLARVAVDAALRRLQVASRGPDVDITGRARRRRRRSTRGRRRSPRNRRDAARGRGSGRAAGA